MKHLLKTRWFAVGLLIAVAAGCKKERTQISESVNSGNNDENVRRFLSVTLGVKQDSVLWDQLNHEYYVPNSVYREKSDSVLARYMSANEYKLNFEK